MAPLPPTARLRGREGELRELGDAFGRLASGHPAIVLVEGEAGIGKTRLLADALADARARRLQVVTGQAPGAGADPPVRGPGRRLRLRRLVS